MTRGSDHRPTRRLTVSAQYGDEYVVEIGAHFINVRPKGSRRGGPAEVSVTPGSLYLILFDAKRAKAKRRAR